MVASFRLAKLNLRQNDKPMNRPISRNSLAWYNRTTTKQETSDVQSGLGPISEVPNGKIARCTVYWLDILDFTV